jgi:hypothetical protein
LNFKVFHDDQDVLGLYFEMFPHVDIPGGYIRFDEKDEDYRENVVKSFAALSASAAWPILTNRRPSSAQFSWIGIPLCKALSFRRRVKRRQEESPVSHPQDKPGTLNSTISPRTTAAAPSTRPVTTLVPPLR